jgi:hypothetical protein
VDPVEERDILKLIIMMDDPRVQEKIAETFVVVPQGLVRFGKLVPKINVFESEQKEG